MHNYLTDNPELLYKINNNVTLSNLRCVQTFHVPSNNHINVQFTHQSYNKISSFNKYFFTKKCKKKKY